MPAESIGAVALDLVERIDEVTEAMVDGYRQRIPDYPRLLHRYHEDVHKVSRTAVLVFLRLLIEEREPTEEELTAIRTAGRARAGQGLSIESMLQAYSIGRDIAWQYIEDAAVAAGVSEDEMMDATVRMARFMERLTLLVTQGYLDAMRQAYEGEQKRMLALVDLAKAMSRSLDLTEVVGVGLERVRRLLDLGWAGLWLVAVEKGVLRVAGQSREASWKGPTIGDAYAEVGLDSPVLGADTVAGKAILYNAVDLPRPIADTGARMLIVVPLHHRDRPLGALAVADRVRDELPQRDREFLGAIGEQMAVAIHQVQEHQREARTDFLTGLANRQEFDGFVRRELARAARFGDHLSLAMIDLDGLKRINDEDGHKAGDEALRLVGVTLKATVRSLDLAARIGGDEFALVMPQTDVKGAQDVVARFQQRLGDIGATAPAPVSVSVGIAEWKEGMSLDTLASAADTELYEAKRHRAPSGQTGL